MTLSQCSIDGAEVTLWVNRSRCVQRQFRNMSVMVCRLNQSTQYRKGSWQ
jgi:hypothetical protein